MKTFVKSISKVLPVLTGSAQAGLGMFPETMLVALIAWQLTTGGGPALAGDVKAVAPIRGSRAAREAARACVLAARRRAWWERRGTEMSGQNVATAG